MPTFLKAKPNKRGKKVACWTTRECATWEMMKDNKMGNIATTKRSNPFGWQVLSWQYKQVEVI